MSAPRFPTNPFTDIVPRRGATSSKAGLDTYRRLAAMEQTMAANTSVDTDALNLYRSLGSSILGFTFDPGALGNTTDNSVALTSATMYLGAIYLPAPATLTGVTTYCETAGVGTWGITRVGLYGVDGTRLALSLSDTSAWKATGFYSKDFSATYDADRGLYYAAILNIRTATTTAPKLASRNAFASGLQSLRTAAAFPRVTSFTGQTDLPTSVTLSSGSITTASRWMGLY